MCDTIKIDSSKMKKIVLFGNAELEGSNLWKRVGVFAKGKDDSSSFPVSFRIIVVDEMQMVSATGQNELKKMMGEHAGFLKWILITKDPGTLIGYIRSQATFLRTKVAIEKDALAILLAVCYRMKIGYDRDGIRELFAQNPKLNLTILIDMLQNIFVKYHFISAENVRKVAGRVSGKLEVQASASLQPFNRCSVCTLFPPCRHLTEVQLSEMGKKRREELPQYNGGMECPQFCRLGYCSLFNRIGRCSLTHPKKYHTIVEPVARCPQCSILWPCNHCSFSESRNNLLNILSEVKDKISILNQLTSSSPPAALSFAVIENYPQYYGELKGIKNQISAEKEALLSTINTWLKESLCVDEYEYLRRVCAHIHSPHQKKIQLLVCYLSV